MLRGHDTERSWLHFFCLGGRINLNRLAPLLPLGREQGAGGMRVGRALNHARNRLLRFNHHQGWEDSDRTECNSQNANSHRSPTSSPRATQKYLVLFASSRLCVSHAYPSHGLRGPCYGVMLQGGGGEEHWTTLEVACCDSIITKVGRIVIALNVVRKTQAAIVRSPHPSE